MAINDDLVDARVRLYNAEKKIEELEKRLAELEGARPASKAMAYQPEEN